MFKSLVLVLLFATLFVANTQDFEETIFSQVWNDNLPISSECQEALALLPEFQNKLEHPSFNHLDVLELLRSGASLLKHCDLEALFNVVDPMGMLSQIAENVDDSSELEGIFNILKAPFNFTLGFIEGLEKDPIKRHSQCKVHFHNASNSTKNIQDLIVPAITNPEARAKLLAEIAKIKEISRKVPTGCQFEDFKYVVQHLNDTAYLAKVALMYTLYKKTIDGAIKSTKDSLIAKNFYGVGNGLGIVTRYLFSITLKEPVQVFALESIEEAMSEIMTFTEKNEDWSLISSFLAQKDD